MLTVFWAIGGCRLPEAVRSPSDEEVGTLLRALVEAQALPQKKRAETLAEFCLIREGGGEPRFRRPTAEELAEFVPGFAFDSLKVEDSRCDRYPVWSVRFRPLGERRLPAMVAEFVKERDEWRLLLRRIPLRRLEDGREVPDFRPRHAGFHETDESMAEPRRGAWVAVVPAWRERFEPSP